MAPERAYFYWLPSVLDGQSRVHSLALRSGVKNLQSIADGKAQGFLNEARDYFVEATKADPSYLPAKINLATTYLFLGKPHQARAILEEALQQAPQNRDALMLKALTIYEQNDVGMDMWMVATKQLEKVVVGSKPDPKAVFNLARLLSIRPRAAKAREYWNNLAGSPEYLPALIKSIVCFNQSIVSPKICRKEQIDTNVKKQWDWPLPSQTSGLLSGKTRLVLHNWQPKLINLNQESLKGFLYASFDSNAEVLELDDFIQMKVIKHKNLGKVSDLQRYCKKQLHRRMLSQGEIWTCGHWAALTRGKNVDEVWWMAK
jgi:tetratricopeptide (TPR) repeat protein